MSSTLWLCLILLASTTSSHARPRASPGISGQEEVSWSADTPKDHHTGIHHSLKDFHDAAKQAVHDAHEFVHQNFHSVVEDIFPHPPRQVVEPFSLVKDVLHQTLGVLEKPSSGINLGLNVQLGGLPTGDSHGVGFQLGLLHQLNHGLSQQNTNIYGPHLSVPHLDSYGAQGTTVHELEPHHGASSESSHGQSLSHINQASHFQSSEQHSEQSFSQSSSHQSSHFQSTGHHSSLNGQNITPLPCSVCGHPVKTNPDILSDPEPDNSTDQSKADETTAIEHDDIDIRFGDQTEK